MVQHRGALTAAIALVVLTTLLLAARCGGTDEGAGGGVANPSPTGTPEYGGSLTVVFQSEAETLDPAIAWDLTGTTIEQSVHQSLLRYKSLPGMAGTELEPCVATEVPEAPNDGMTYTFTIRQGVDFHPPVARQVTAADVKYSFERMMNLPLAPATYFYVGVVGAEEFQAGKADEITGVKVIDDQTLQIDLVEPDPAFWWDPKIEQMILDARSKTGEARYADYTAMQEIIMDNAPYVPLFQPTMTTMCPTGTGGFYLNLVYWFDPASYWRIQE